MDVKQIQHLLAYLGYYTASVDGLDGPKTQAAVRMFQKDFTGLQVDGIPGNETQKALRHAVAYGMPEREKPEEDSGTSSSTGTFWDEVRYFRREEFRCPCGRCGGFPVEPEEALVRAADRVREHFGKPICISSGVRCQAHNDELPGSVKNSRHIRGKAMDFSISGFSASAVLPYLQSLVRSGQLRYVYAINENYVHMDVQ